MMMLPNGCIPSSSTKDSFWLQLEVCREFQRSRCSRSDGECKFAHPPAQVELEPNGRVIACYDSIKGRCQRDKCKYLHPPAHLRDQLLINGRNHLALKQAFLIQQRSPNSLSLGPRKHQIASSLDLHHLLPQQQQQQQQHQQPQQHQIIHPNHNNHLHNHPNQHHHHHHHNHHQQQRNAILNINHPTLAPAVSGATHASNHQSNHTTALIQAALALLQEQQQQQQQNNQMAAYTQMAQSHPQAAAIAAAALAVNPFVTSAASGHLHPNGAHVAPPANVPPPCPAASAPATPTSYASQLAAATAAAAAALAAAASTTAPAPAPPSPSAPQNTTSGPTGAMYHEQLVAAAAAAAASSFWGASGGGVPNVGQQQQQRQSPRPHIAKLAELVATGQLNHQQPVIGIGCYQLNKSPSDPISNSGRGLENGCAASSTATATTTTKTTTTTTGMSNDDGPANDATRCDKRQLDECDEKPAFATAGVTIGFREDVSGSNQIEALPPSKRPCIGPTHGRVEDIIENVGSSDNLGDLVTAINDYEHNADCQASKRNSLQVTLDGHSGGQLDEVVEGQKVTLKADNNNTTKTGQNHISQQNGVNKTGGIDQSQSALIGQVVERDNEDGSSPFGSASTSSSAGSSFDQHSDGANAKLLMKTKQYQAENDFIRLNGDTNRLGQGRFVAINHSTGLQQITGHRVDETSDGTLISGQNVANTTTTSNNNRLLTIICKDFLRGKCFRRNNSRCRYLHPRTHLQCQLTPNGNATTISHSKPWPSRPSANIASDNTSRTRFNWINRANYNQER